MIVDPACPLDWSHPLNVGLVADFTILPNVGWGGGKTLRNLYRDGRTSNGTLANSPSWSRSPFGRSLKFTSASNQNVAVPSSPELNLQPPFTICGWAWRASGSAMIAAKWDDFTGNKRQYLLRLDGVARFTTSTNGSTQSALNSAAVSASTWYFVLGMYDGTNAYISLNGNVPTSAIRGGSLYTDNTVSLTIGSTVSATYSDGYVHGTMLYNRVLSNAEIAALYQETQAGNPNRLRWLSSPNYLIPSTGNRRRRLLCGSAA